jgi:hypothetical protein
MNVSPEFVLQVNACDCANTPVDAIANTATNTNFFMINSPILTLL